ncbi:MAG: hypothetical protein HOV79_27300 [Hamadaea sp.]|nr:hypothetical protein [Hamadaea sp.]
MDRRRERLAQALDETGLWRSADPGERREHLAAIRAGAYPLDLPIFDDVRFPADGDRLADGGVADLLAAMAPALAEHGIVLRVRVLAHSDRKYAVEINDRVCVIWDDTVPALIPTQRAGALTQPVAGAPPVGHAATVRPLAVVNDLLARDTAAVRVFTLYTGDAQGTAYLLDLRVIRALRACGLFDRRELPELAAAERR